MPPRFKRGQMEGGHEHFCQRKRGEPYAPSSRYYFEAPSRRCKICRRCPWRPAGKNEGTTGKGECRRRVARVRRWGCEERKCRGVGNLPLFCLETHNPDDSIIYRAETVDGRVGWRVPNLSVCNHREFLGHTLAYDRRDGGCDVRAALLNPPVCFMLEL